MKITNMKILIDKYIYIYIEREIDIDIEKWKIWNIRKMLQISNKSN